MPRARSRDARAAASFLVSGWPLPGLLRRQETEEGRSRGLASPGSLRSPEWPRRGLEPRRRDPLLSGLDLRRSPRPGRRRPIRTRDEGRRRAARVDIAGRLSPRRAPLPYMAGSHAARKSRGQRGLPLRARLEREDAGARTRSNVVYASGQLLYMREHVLLAQPFDAGRGRLAGEPVPLAETSSTTAVTSEANSEPRKMASLSTRPAPLLRTRNSTGTTARANAREILWATPRGNRAFRDLARPDDALPPDRRPRHGLDIWISTLAERRPASLSARFRRVQSGRPTGVASRLRSERHGGPPRVVRRKALGWFRREEILTPTGACLPRGLVPRRAVPGFHRGDEHHQEEGCL